jgi:hypothetical protein
MTEPTDAEIEVAWTEATGSSILPYPDDMLAFARAVLAKWGQPSGAGEPVAWQEYAQHLEYCRTCAEDGIGACDEGARLKVNAMLATPIQPAEPQPMPDLTQLTERGAKAWAGVDVQALREGRVPLTADDIKEPKNGRDWRVEWWNESCRMMLPACMKLDSFQSYKNGTLMFTLKKRTDVGIKHKEGGEDG